MAANITDTHAAVTVFVQGGGQADVAMDLDMKVHDAILYLLPYLQDAFKQHGRDTTALEDRTAQWQLVKGFNDTLDPSATLGAMGVKSGNKLRLVKTMAKEKYPALIDDVPESIAQYQIEKYKAWDDTSSRIAVGLILPILALAVATVTSIYTLRGVELLHHIVAGSVTIVVGVALCVLAARVSSKNRSKDIQRASKPGSVAAFSGLVLIAGGTLSAIPAAASLWHVLAASIVTCAVGATLKSVTHGVESVCYGVIVCSGVIAAAAGVSLLLPDASVAQFGALGAAFGMVFLMFASSMALRAAKVPAPFVPTLGESYVNPNETADITLLPTSASTEALEAIINREQQTVDAHSAILGMTAGGLGAILVSLCAAATLGVDRPGVLLAMMVVLVVAMLFRAVSYEDMATQAVWLAGVTLIVTCVPVCVALLSEFGVYAVGLSAVGFVGAALAAFRVVSGAKTTSPLVKHRFEIFEFVCYVAVFVLLALVLDVYGVARYM